MTAKGKQWVAQDVPLVELNAHCDFQFRVEGLNTTHLNGILRTLEGGGEARDPIRVARIGKVLYVVDGFHRLEAYRQAGRITIAAKVAKMSLPDARDYARGVNGMNGKPYTQKDKRAAWQSYLAEGRHFDDGGNLKASRVIAAELGGGVYSHTTVRAKLKEAGHELDVETEFGGHYKPRGSDDESEWIAEDAEGHLRAFGGLVWALEPYQRDRLLTAARGIVETAKEGREPDLASLLQPLLNI